MIRSVSLWHVTPVDLGVEFFDPSDTTLAADESLYRLVNDPELPVDKQAFSRQDYKAIQEMRRFLEEVRLRCSLRKNQATFVEQYPGIQGCIAKYQVAEQMFCYVLVNGTAVFFERGTPIPVEEERYFAINAFYERQVYEDDYCCNPEDSPRKKPLYDFLQLLWRCVGNKEFSYSASEKYGNRGVPYTLCITMVDIPDLVSNRVDLQMKKNFRALLDTSAFNNIYKKEQWNTIRERIDNDGIDDLELKELSETLVFADNWSGVLLAGDLEKNQTCITWLMEFEIFLQSQWLLFDAYSENIVRMELSSMQLQGILNRVEFVKIKLDNDISSNMEPSRHIMRNSLIRSSDINTIYERMHGLISNKLKLKIMGDERKKSRFALLSDLSLLIIALLQIYGVVGELLTKTTFTHNDLITMAVMAGITAVCVWVMIKGRN
ncbi:MAG: hypothetical protein IJ043_03810 [Clostridia bacterium]|nr:hypothetical protein [Clostridia bacterium]